MFSADRQRRRILSLALSLLLALTALACSDDTDGQNNGGSDASTVDAGDVEESDDASDVGDTDDDDIDEMDVIEDTAEDTRDGGDDGGSDGGEVEEDTGPAALEIDAIVPNRGPVEGGTPFVIEGAGFTDETVVYFGSRQAQVTLVDGELVGDTPEGPGVGPVNVKLIDQDTGDDVLEGGFTYTATVRIDSISPRRIPTSGGVEVQVDGAGFSSETRVSFGGETALRHEYVDDATLRVLAPSHPAGVVDVRVSDRNGTDVLAAGAEYFEELRIDAVRPASGSTAGGDTVTIEGAGFADGMTVEFGGNTATVTNVDAAGATATVTTPAAASAGLVDVRAERADGEADIAVDAFYYASQPSAFEIAAVQPDTAVESGGVEVTIIGAGLDAAGLSVEFDTSPVNQVVEQGPGHAVVQIPAHAPGIVDVTIADGNGNTDTLVQGFEYVADLWVDRVTPDTGPVAGGNTVTIEGEGFTSARRVEFGGVSAAFTVVSDTEISATAPARSAGSVDVRVERGDVSATLVDGYTYEESLQVFGFTPVRGSVAGGTYVEIRGRGFIGSPDVTFDGDAAASVQTLDAQTLAVRTPPHATGAVDVVVTRGSESVTAPEQYTYFNPGSRFGGSWGGPIQGAVNVTVYAQGGSPIEGAYVQLSTNPQTTYTGETDQNGMVTLSGPDVYGEQTVTATAPEYSSATVQDVNAENITIFLSPPPSQGPPPPGPPTATFTGQLTGLNKIKEPGPTEIQVAYVTTTKVDPWSRNPAPGDGATVFNDGPYTINSRIGDLALVAVGGLYDNATDEFTPLALGVERYLFASEGQTYNVDLDLNIPLDTTVNYKVDAPPLTTNGPTIHRVMPFLDFGFEGVWQMQTFGEDTSNIVGVANQADLTGVLADVDYWAMGGAYTNGNAPPLSVAFKGGISNANALVTMPQSPTIARVTSPADGQVPTNGLIKFDANVSATPDFYYVRVMTFQQATVYEAFLPGSATSFRFPDFPDFSHLPAEDRPVPYPGGTYQLMIIGVNQQGTSIDDWSYSDLALDSWQSYSLWSQLISF
jgi:hypothetical protein